MTLERLVVLGAGAVGGSIGGLLWERGLLATKLQDAEPALDDLVSAAGRELPVVCATNGVHGERWAAARFERMLSTLVWL